MNYFSIRYLRIAKPDEKAEVEQDLIPVDLLIMRPIRNINYL